MSNRTNRLNELAKLNPLAAADHRNLKNSNGKLSHIESLSREERRKIQRGAKKLEEAYTNKMRFQSLSGANFPTDKILREMAGEYNNRYRSSGAYNQPISFNYFEPFLHVKLLEQAAPFAEIETEVNHLFYPTDFFDYITSADSIEFDITSLTDLPQDQIFHFSASGNVTDISFTNGVGNEFVVSGFSMIRRGAFLNWYLIGGEAISAEEWQTRTTNNQIETLQNTPPWKKAFITEIVKSKGYSIGAPLPLEGTTTHIRTIIAGEFDLTEKKHLTRCYLAEYENSFDVICDDPEVFTSIKNSDEYTKITELMKDRVQQSAVLWTLAEGLFQLPNYFSIRISLNKENKADYRVAKKKGREGLNSKYVVIPSLDTDSKKPTSTITVVKLPQYEIETEGHWKRLEKSQYGTDRHGNKIKGRTWIPSSSKWKTLGHETKTIFLKDTLAAARFKINEYLAEISKLEENKLADASGKGSLYIMRCSLFVDQVYKVGFTTSNAETRAKQLSSNTGVPAAFTVLRQWPHEDAQKLEAEVHMMLSQYRINDNREFFMASFESIVNVIESVIARTSN